MRAEGKEDWLTTSECHIRFLYSCKWIFECVRIKTMDADSHSTEHPSRVSNRRPLADSRVLIHPQRVPYPTMAV